MKKLIQLFFFLFVMHYVYVSCSPEFKKGEKIYETHCGNCHGKNAEGFKRLYPPLSNSAFVSTTPKEMPCIIRHGIHEVRIINGITYDTPMEGNLDLSEIDITNLINYIYYKWYDRKFEVSLIDVKEQLTYCKNEEY